MKLKFISNWPVMFRGALYFLVAFLIPFTDGIKEFLVKDMWPSLPRVTLAFLVGMGAAFVALRAYYDGSAQRHSDEQDKTTKTNEKNINAGVADVGSGL